MLVVVGTGVEVHHDRRGGTLENGNIDSEEIGKNGQMNEKRIANKILEVAAANSRPNDGRSSSSTPKMGEQVGRCAHTAAKGSEVSVKLKSQKGAAGLSASSSSTLLEKAAERRGRGRGGSRQQREACKLVMIGVIELEDRMSRFVTFKMIHHYGTVRDAYKHACSIGYEKHTKKNPCFCTFCRSLALPGKLRS